ncbi:dihydroneopterin aldolase [Campylobacter pinnipediorum subsp. caledonicus]|uniref:Dihydroneopterin aldolase n=1 Tax=Campylobacter pinnipediorum subsp. caledonicus TaxID=1874362 RepID=A0A1S6U6R1_9BACT|nr:dihydroneopterin aldolase [Campylobacter pinnipediorum]AQW85833.1 dihydroneopterin aldolase [Campylobacter pinnipediorum subsp. caledonicus]AQW87444.1 dihydroneopterin aldolase [Campylobacter pinnipediorum subsp. caledonicus]
MKQTLTTYIKDFEFKTIIGMCDFERVTPQKIKINAEYQSNDFIDYVEVINFIRYTYDDYKFEKLEDSLKIISEKLKENFQNLISIKIEIFKLEIIKNAIVGAKIEVVY